VGRGGEVVCSSPTQCRPVFEAGIANSIMPAKGYHPNDQRISEVDAVVRGLILDVSELHPGFRKWGLCVTHF